RAREREAAERAQRRAALEAEAKALPKEAKAAARELTAAGETLRGALRGVADALANLLAADARYGRLRARADALRAELGRPVSVPALPRLAGLDKGMLEVLDFALRAHAASGVK